MVTLSPLMHRLLFTSLALLALPLQAEPQWIWTSKTPKDGEKASFTKTIKLEGNPKIARLTFTCDNGATAFINGKKVGVNTLWSDPTKEKVTDFLRPGDNEIRFDAENSDSVAGLVAVLIIKTDSGKEEMVIETGPDWMAKETGSASLKPAVVVAKYGDEPWGKALIQKTADASSLPDTTQIQVLPGFKAERIYTVPKEKEGSWVGLTEDPKGRLIACDQYGGIYRVTVPAIGTEEEIKVEPIPLPLGPNGETVGGAHGLLYAFDSLYLMNNELKGKGLWRFKDTNGDDKFDTAEHLIALDEGGEHGVHSLALSPDGKSIFFVNGNHTSVPKDLAVNRIVAMKEDHLIPRMWDPNGHAKGFMAPGGYICKADPDGKNIELFAGGFRNQYDISFDANGELFSYDSDMEWDMGTPWYMPTRINHAVSGGDYGWRSGSGRWPAYYEDSLPASVDIGPGSPTGSVFGTGAKFPAKYQRAFFALDWTYGTMWAIHNEPDGASFKSVKEEFVAGKPMPFTDAIIHKKDGAMYFTTGGRRSQAALYRVTYTGSESTAPAPKVEPTPEAKLRHLLESGTPESLTQAWTNLSHKDRFIRFAARAAIERQPVEKWADKALAETDPQASITAMIALARLGDKSHQPKIIVSLGRLDFNKLAKDLRLPYLRAWQLSLIRMGKPAPEVCEKIVERIEPSFPSNDAFVNRELLALLVSLDSKTIVAKAVPMLTTVVDSDITVTSDSVLARNDRYSKAVEGMHGNRPNRQAIFFANALREARVGWTPELQKAYFSWFASTQSWNGGNSFRKYIDAICKLALENCVSTPDERSALSALATAVTPTVVAPIVAPKGPGKDYTTDEIVALAEAGLKKRNFEQGKAMFSSVLCINCHHFGGQGGNTGPDLTGSGNRYTIRDLTENITEPSKVISDQYPSEIISLKNGQTVTGRVVVEENNVLSVMTSAFVPNALTSVADADIVDRKINPVSMMPASLLNALNKDELLDLYAYILSGGNPEDSRFK
jgi:putative heme-binding domain-containing protein